MDKTNISLLIYDHFRLRSGTVDKYDLTLDQNVYVN